MLDQLGVDANNLLARLLATEDIKIRYRKARTASFDVKHRVLTFPLWANMTDSIYKLFVGHEIGHALYTPQTATAQSVGSIIAPTNWQRGFDYLQITEDARIESMIRAKYPGFARIFAEGYRDLCDLRDVFGLNNSPIASRSLIDRINLYFKIGHLVRVSFTSEEQVLVQQVRSALTFQDAVLAAKAIYDFAAQQPEEPPPASVPNPAEDEPTEEDDSAEEEPSEENDPDESPAPDSPEGTSSTSEADEEEDSASPSSPQCSGPGSEPPPPTTQEHFDQNIQNLNESAMDVVQVSLPKPKLDTIVIDYKIVHMNLASQIQAPTREAAERKFTYFQRQTESAVNYMFSEFQVWKRAEEYRRTEVSRTGVLNTNRLASYKTNTNLFRELHTVAKGKSHGLVFVVDWSGSMSASMAGTIQQLVNLVLFCVKAQIPFEVYSITEDRRESGYADAFEIKPGDLLFHQRFRMRNYLSSRMTSNELRTAFVHLFAMIPNDGWEDRGAADALIGCTPLDEAIITTHDLIRWFRARTGVQLVHAVFLTDGYANTVTDYALDTGKPTPIVPGPLYILENRDRRSYRTTSANITPTLLQSLRESEGINVVGFYVMRALDIPREVARFVKPEEIHERSGVLEDQKFLVVEAWGYSELYLILGEESLQIKQCRISVPPGSPVHPSEFREALRSITNNRVFLIRFIRLIS